MKLGLLTLGCRLNALESEAIAEQFKKNGWIVENKLSDDDDLIIINTCTVTSKADSSARRLIRKYGSDIEVIVTGCYVNVATESEIENLAPLVRVVKEKEKLLSYAENYNKKINDIKINKNDIDLVKNDISYDSKSERDPFAFMPLSFLFHSRASLKIQDGCNNSCSFCLTHIARGKGISLSPSVVRERIKMLEENGYKEICLTGVNLASYSKDGMNLTRLLKYILPSLNENTRLRFSSLEPDFLDAEFFTVIKDEHIFPFFHLPIQSASDRVIELTGRKYTKKDLERIVDNLRKSKDNPYIAADIIAGLPGEEERDANETYNFLEKNQFSRLHVFPYSPREGTKAKLQKHPPERIRDERAERLNALSLKLYQNYIKTNNGKILEAITENVVKDDTFVTTENYIKAKIKGKTLEEGLLLNGKLKANENGDIEYIVGHIIL